MSAYDSLYSSMPSFPLQISRRMMILALLLYHFSLSCLQYFMRLAAVNFVLNFTITVNDNNSNIGSSNNKCTHILMTHFGNVVAVVYLFFFFTFYLPTYFSNSFSFTFFALLFSPITKYNISRKLSFNTSSFMFCQHCLLAHTQHVCQSEEREEKIMFVTNTNKQNITLTLLGTSVTHPTTEQPASQPIHPSMMGIECE